MNYEHFGFTKTKAADAPKASAEASGRGWGWKEEESPSTSLLGGESTSADQGEGLDWFGDFFGADLAGPANWTLEGDLLEIEAVEESMELQTSYGDSPEELEALSADLEKITEKLESIWLDAPLEDELDFFG